jgi:hypothetical protein
MSRALQEQGSRHLATPLNEAFGGQEAIYANWRGSAISR